MPERPTVVSYAAGASLAAVALIYVFGPTFALDGGDATSNKKKTIVGLRNQANDCFINSILQSLAGLPDLRLYLIRETHRRRIEDPKVYTNIVLQDNEAGNGGQMPQWKLQGMQEGLVTQGLKEMLDALNERPIAKKSISPHPFVRVLEVAFKQRISRQQQDAQEFLQIVAERLKDEYHAGQRARAQARRLGLTPSTEALTKSATNVDATATDTLGKAATSDGENPDGADGENPDGDDGRPTATKTLSESTLATSNASTEKIQLPLDLEDGFPMEGRYESNLECQTCRYQTKPREESFCTLTLAVPQVSSTSLSACFDGIFKTEYIDEFKCEMCRLLQTTENLEAELSRSTSESFREATRVKIERLREAMATDPENPPEDVELGDIRYAPKRKIAKTTRMTVFPKILAVHLSRSIYGGAITQKNMAKVSFPERLPMGSIADQRRYKLLGTVSHKGGHNSGHYEAFRRQNPPPTPFYHANTFQRSDVYSRTPTPASTPEISALNGIAGASPAVSTPDLLSASSGDSSSGISVETPATGRSHIAPPRSVPSPMIPSPTTTRDPETTSLRSVAASTKSALSRLASPRSDSPSRHLSNPVSGGSSSTPRNASPAPVAQQIKHQKKAKKRQSDKWWRVSDEKVREAKTSEVLGMQKEVYLLFYELERGDEA
ncbi:ubiquitin carboxyl-terminal hydrolase domain-containing protein [Sarocladium implicatum]|nr:ubiquitin carboxyl-terminal hydrolase domain-containing protein [Sarocladium implicatum]